MVGKRGTERQVERKKGDRNIEREEDILQEGDRQNVARRTACRMGWRGLMLLSAVPADAGILRLI